MSHQLLTDAINNIIPKAQTYLDIYSRNETAVRDQLINPILNALGWDITNPDIVLPNQLGPDGRVLDYSLLKNKRIKLIVEGKHIGIDLGEDGAISQLGSYCHTRSIDFGLLTNGVEWLLFKTAEQTIAEHIAWHIDIRKDGAKAVEKLALLFYDKIELLEDELRRSKALKSYFEPITSSQDAFLDWCKATAKEAFLKENKTLRFQSNEIEAYLQKQLDRLFSTPPIIDTVPPQPHPEEETNTKDGGRGNNEGLRERIKPTKLKITFTDGTVFDDNKAASAFTKAIGKIGIERVKALRIVISSVPLISTTKHERYGQFQLGDYYIMTNTSTAVKHELLTRIAQRLGIDLKVEVVFK